MKTPVFETDTDHIFLSLYNNPCNLCQGGERTQHRQRLSYVLSWNVCGFMAFQTCCVGFRERLARIRP